MKKKELINTTKVLLNAVGKKEYTESKFITIEEKIRFNSLLRALNKLQIQDQYNNSL